MVRSGEENGDCGGEKGRRWSRKVAAPRLPCMQHCIALHPPTWSVVQTLVVRHLDIFGTRRSEEEEVSIGNGSMQNVPLHAVVCMTSGSAFEQVSSAGRVI